MRHHACCLRKTIIIDCYSLRNSNRLRKRIQRLHNLRMRILSFLFADVLVVLIGFASSFHVSHNQVVKVVEDAGNFETDTGIYSQPEYTVFLDEKEVGVKQDFHGISKRGYYTCYNRQVRSDHDLGSI